MCLCVYGCWLTDSRCELIKHGADNDDDDDDKTYANSSHPRVVWTWHEPIRANPSTHGHQSLSNLRH